MQLSNPKTIEFEVVRTSLLPGLMKCLQMNKGEPIPQKMFELSDCCILDPQGETGAQNVRKVAAVVIDLTANFEVIHGLLDLIMNKVGADSDKKGRQYSLKQDDSDPRYFPTRGVQVLLGEKIVGSMGVIHPEVLGNSELKYPVSALELDFDALFAHFKSIQ